MKDGKEGLKSKASDLTPMASVFNGANDPVQLMTIDEVAGLLRVPKSWVYERTRRRGVQKLPHLKLGKYLRFRPADVQQYLEKLRVA